MHYIASITQIHCSCLIYNYNNNILIGIMEFHEAFRFFAFKSRFMLNLLIAISCIQKGSLFYAIDGC